jgi:predicted secreted protein
MMATHLGKDGVIKIQNQTVAEVRSWTLNMAAELVDASCLGDDWKVHQPTIKSWHGSLSCFWDASDVLQTSLTVGKSIELTLYPAGDEAQQASFTGTAFITARDYTGSHSGLVEANLTFQGSGALVQTLAGSSVAPQARSSSSKKAE